MNGRTCVKDTRPDSATPSPWHLAQLLMQLLIEGPFPSILPDRRRAALASISTSLNTSRWHLICTAATMPAARQRR